MSNSTLSGNSASPGSGSAILAIETMVTNSTLTLNRSPGGGIAKRSTTGLLVVNNTIVAGNIPQTSFVPGSFTQTRVVNPDIPSKVTEGSHNLLGTAGAGGLTNGMNGNIVGISDITTVLDPTLAPNGTNIFAGDPNAGQQPVLTHALVSGSPAIDAGNNGLPTVTTDQRGLPRVVGAEVDIGSFEVQ